MNKAIIVGNLARDPEYRILNNGTSVCTFTVAVNRTFANQNGEREADFIAVQAWRERADACEKYLRKGSKVAVCGRIQTRSYEAQDGSKRYVTEIVAEEVEFLTKQPENGKYAAPAQEGVPDYKPPQPQYTQGKISDLETVEDEDLPF